MRKDKEEKSSKIIDVYLFSSGGNKSVKIRHLCFRVIRSLTNSNRFVPSPITYGTFCCRTDPT